MGQVAGEKPGQRGAVYEGKMPLPYSDPPLKDRPKRPCSKCGRKFQPTAKRRMLCEHCYRAAD